MHTKHHIEREIKLTATDEATLDNILNCDLVKQSLNTNFPISDGEIHNGIYYDTPDWALRQIKWSLRTRREGERHICTLKRSSQLVDGYSSCEEMEQNVVAGFECVGDIPTGRILIEMESVFDSSTPLLKRVFVNMCRNKRYITLGNTKIELVTDAGTITANGQSKSLYEVELELIDGDLESSQAKSFTRRLQHQFGLTPSLKSKHRTGLDLFKNLA